MELYFICRECRSGKIWKVRIHGTRPHARAQMGDLKCPRCGAILVECGMEEFLNGGSHPEPVPISPA